ncbi:MAG: hypothetical protein AAF843_04570 [Bacteroidota bacterium]
MIRSILASILLLLLTIPLVLSQAKTRLLPSNINKPSINYYAPFISGDGSTLLYLHDYTDEGHHAMMTATKKTVSTWHDGIEVNKLINRPTLNLRGGYSLSFDADMMYFSSRKSGLGGFDLWSSKRRGNDWEAPKNLGAPANSRENEGAPCLSPDGEYLYYMRCDKMSEYGGASGCRIVRSKRTNRGWSEPEDLPGNINTGNSQTPRLLADGISMIFASDQFGGVGGLDLYMTKKQGDEWTEPVPLDFLNTDKNDQFVSTDAKGRYMYVAENTGRNSQLVMKLIPEDLQPTKVMRIKGKVVNGETGDPISANLTIFNVDERDRLWNEKLGSNGEFAIVLNEGASYDLAVESLESGVMYYSKVFDLNTVGVRDKQTLNIRLEPIQLEKSYETEIRFEENKAVLKDNSTFELRRISNMLRKNPTMRVELISSLNGYRSDSIPSDADLTEVLVDSVYITREVPLELDTTVLLKDSIPDDSLSLDSTLVDQEEGKDSIRYEMVEELQLKYTYHNDRTEAEVTAVKDYLIERGIDESRIDTSVKIDKDSNGSEVKPEEPIEIRKMYLRILEM